MKFLNFLAKKIELMNKYADTPSKTGSKTSDIKSIFKNGLSKDELDIDYDELAKKLTDSNGSLFAEDLSLNVENIFEEFLNLAGTDELDGILDSGYKDGIITAEELESYMNQLMGEDELLSMSDFEDAIISAGVDIEEEYKSQMQELEDYFDDIGTERAKSASSSSAAGGAGGGGGGGGGGGVSAGGGGGGVNAGSTPQQPTIKPAKNMSLNELKSEQQETINTLSGNKAKFDDAIEAREENQTKQQEYIDQLNATQDETAIALAGKITEISENETAIFQAQQNINNSNATIASLQGTISSLQGQIASLQAQQSQPEGSESGETVDNSAAIGELQSQITAAEEQIKQEQANITQYEQDLADANAKKEAATQEQAELESKLSVDIVSQLSEAKAAYTQEQAANNTAIVEAQKAVNDCQERLDEINQYIALKEQPQDLSEEGNEFLDKINNPDKTTKLNEEHYQDLYAEINNSDLSVSEKIYLMSQMKSAVNTDTSLAGLENMFEEFVEQDEVKEALENDAMGKLKFQADFIQNNSTESLGNLKKNGEINTISHRGSGAKDNSIEGIQNAIEQGYDSVEVDVRFDSNGNPVLSHDQISGDASNLATLEDALTTIKDSGTNTNLYIELKDNMSQEQVDKLINMVKEKGLENQITWISFNADNLKEVNQSNPNARLGYLTNSQISTSTLQTLQSLKTENNEVFLDAKASSLTDQVLESLNNAGIEFEAWGVDDKATCEKLIKANCKGITTDGLTDEVVEDIAKKIIKTKEQEEISRLANAGKRGELFLDNLKYDMTKYKNGDYYIETMGGVYQYMIAVPEGVDPNADLPVLFYLSGKGTNEAGNDVAQNNTYGPLAQRIGGFNGIIVMPLFNGVGTDIGDAHINDINAICDSIKGQFPNADTKNMGLIGFSDGSNRAYQVVNADGLNGNSAHHFSSAVMIDGAKRYTDEYNKKFQENGISLGVYYNVERADCSKITVAEFNEFLGSSHGDCNTQALNRKTIEFLFRNRLN